MLEHSSAVDDRGAVAYLLDLAELMGGQEYCAPFVLCERADQLAELDDARRIEAVARLIEDQQLRVGEQGAGHPEPLAHPRGVALDAVICAVGKSDAG